MARTNTQTPEDTTDDPKHPEEDEDAYIAAGTKTPAVSSIVTSLAKTPTAVANATPINVLAPASAAPSPIAPSNSAGGVSPLAPTAVPSPMEQAIQRQEAADAALVKNQEAELKNIEEGEKKKETEKAKTQEKLGEIALKKGLLKAPPMEQVPYKPTKPTSIVDQWGSAAMIFAMLGSMFSRNHAVTALNAAAAAMNGFKQGDEAAAKQGLEEWKVANANMLKAHDFQQKAYEEAFKGYDTEAKLAEIAGTKKEKEIDANVKALNTALQHNNLETLRSQGGLVAALRGLDVEKKNAETVALNAEKFEEQKRANDARIAEQTARTEKLQAEMKRKEDVSKLLESREYLAAAPAQRAAMVDKIMGDTKQSNLVAKAEAQLKRGGKVKEDEVESIAQAMAGLDYPIPSSAKMGADENLRKAFMRAREIKPGFATDFDARKRDLIDIESGQTSKTIKALDTAENHVESFLKALKDKPGVNDVGKLNSWASALSKSVNGPAQIRYEVVAEVIANEIVKAIQGGGASGALADREGLRRIFSNALSTGSGEAVADELQELLNGQRLGIAQAKGRFFTPEQLFGNKRGAAVRAYGEESESGGIDAFPSNAYQQPTKTLEEMRRVGYTDGKPPEVPAAAPAPAPAPSAPAAGATGGARRVADPNPTLYWRGRGDGAERDAALEQQAIKAFGAYQPDKYEYGEIPNTGKFSRMLRAQSATNARPLGIPENASPYHDAEGDFFWDGAAKIGYDKATGEMFTYDAANKRVYK